MRWLDIAPDTTNNFPLEEQCSQTAHLVLIVHHHFATFRLVCGYEQRNGGACNKAAVTAMNSMASMLRTYALHTDRDSDKGFVLHGWIATTVTSQGILLLMIGSGFSNAAFMADGFKSLLLKAPAS